MEENKGKLKSHWWFFKIVCEKLDPYYCFQLDCGTVPVPESLYHFWKYLENNKNIGAAASRVQVPTPLKPYSILQTWQYGDFAAQKLFDWPAEIISGYLTVLPGQFCVFRWKAISSNDEKTTTGEAQNLSPLDNYFRGLSNLGPFESNMFLAEDRILGYEIISRKDNGWQLAYVPEVVAITDTCETLTELFHQRRRWINSSFACNLWLIFKIFNYLKESGASFKQKIHTVFAIPWLVANCLIQWVFPSLMLILIGSLLSTEISKESSVIITYLIRNFSLPLFSLMMIVQVIIFYHKRLSDKIEKVIIGTSIIQALIIFAGIIYWLINQEFILGKLNLITILLIETSILLFTAGLLSKNFFWDLLKNVLQFMILRPFMLMLLTMYSFSNVHDCSWGTKGLNNSSGRIKSSSGNIKSLQFKKFRVVTLGIWISSNLLLTIYFLYQTYAYKKSLMEILLYFFIVFTGFKIISALIFAVKPFCKKLKISENGV
jgi:cellulose synthase/poly-beta-1,6-N-acetylglucosamine synthase-like glycosyltransferase